MPRGQREVPALHAPGCLPPGQPTSALHPGEVSRAQGPAIAERRCDSRCPSLARGPRACPRRALSPPPEPSSASLASAPGSPHHAQVACTHFPLPHSCWGLCDPPATRALLASDRPGAAGAPGTVWPRIPAPGQLLASWELQLVPGRGHVAGLGCSRQGWAGWGGSWPRIEPRRPAGGVRSRGPRATNGPRLLPTTWHGACSLGSRGTTSVPGRAVKSALSRRAQGRERKTRPQAQRGGPRRGRGRVPGAVTCCLSLRGVRRSEGSCWAPPAWAGTAGGRRLRMGQALSRALQLWGDWCHLP